MVARWLNHDRDVPRQVSAVQMRLWHALHDFIRQQGGAVVSVPGRKEVRIEVPKDSTLPVKLSALGYQPHHHCATTRISAGKFESVDVVSITMPGK